MFTIVVGLGNPGEKFDKTRHNAGFMALDFFAKQNNFPEFEFSKKFNAIVSQKDNSDILQNNRVILAKPQTFMNESGKAVSAILKKSKENMLVVIHDDIDLPLGTIKISKDSGSGGHKGVASIIEHLGTKAFTRIRIGICPPNGKPEKVELFVIQKFTEEEMAILQPVFIKIATELDALTNRLVAE